MAVTTTQTNKPLNPRGNDQSPKGYNRAAVYSGKALDFDGVNDNIVASSFSGLSGEAKASVSLYFNWDSINTGENWFIGQDNPTNRVFAFGYAGSTNELKLQINGTNTTGTGTYNFNTGEWYHYLFTFDTTTNAVVIYVNGQQVATGTQTKDFISATSDLYIGQREYSGNEGRINGKIANVKIFNEVLTAAQVADLYNNPEKVVPTGVADSALKLWLPMMEGAGTTAYDGSGNGNHGTISGATWTHGIGSPVAQTAVIDWNKGTNLATFSEDFSDSDWIALTSTKVSTSETDPIGGSTAVNISWTNGGGAYLYQATIQAGAHTVSMYVKSNGGGNSFRLFGDGVAQTSSNFTATNEWQRFDYSFTASGGSSWGIRGVSGQAADLLVAFAQLEATDSVGPYIPNHTGTAITSEVLLPAGLTTGRDITGVNLFENVRKQGALNLDGNSWAEVHDNASLDITDAITLEAWVYWDGTSDKGFLGRYMTLTGERSYLLYKSNANNFAIFVSSDGTSANSDFKSNATNISEGWNHLVGVYDGSSLKVYLNGSIDGSKSTAISSLYTSDEPIEIGRYRETPTQSHENQIAQPRIYNRALTAEEVARNYNAGKNIYK